MLASEEAEQIARLGLERLTQRGMLALRSDGHVVLGPHPHAGELLAYYSRSLVALDAPGLTSDRSRSSAPIGIPMR